jgi:glycerol uptake facilitator-like aquaporin
VLIVLAVFIGRKLSPRTGGCINPSVGIAFHLATAVIERRTDLLVTDLWVFILGPTIGSYLAYKTYHVFIKPCSPLLK